MESSGSSYVTAVGFRFHEARGLGPGALSGPWTRLLTTISVLYLILYIDMHALTIFFLHICLEND